MDEKLLMEIVAAIKQHTPDHDYEFTKMSSTLTLDSMGNISYDDVCSRCIIRYKPNGANGSRLHVGSILVRDGYIKVNTHSWLMDIPLSNPESIYEAAQTVNKIIG